MKDKNTETILAPRGGFGRMLAVSTAGVALATGLGAQSTDIGFESPTYQPTVLDGQDGWTTNTNQGTVNVVDSTTTHFGSIFAGSQMVELDKTVTVSGGPDMIRSLDSSFSDTFTFSFAYGYTQTASGNLNDAPRISFQSSTSSDFVQMGVRQTERFLWRDGSNLAGSAGNSAPPDTFFVFSGEVRPNDGTWDLTITNASNSAVLVNETGLGITNHSSAGSSTFDQIEFTNIGDDGTVIAVDDISVVPEPTTYALFGGLLAFGAVMLRRRRS